LPTPTSSSANLRAEVTKLQEQLRDAELAVKAACRTNADVVADRMRDELTQACTRLQEAEQIEATQAADRERQQQAAAMLSLENEILQARSVIDNLKRQLAELPGKLNLAQYRHSQLLRAKTELRKGIA
jgi:CII-binding regulator of phage lambda lysogenization HflD